MAISMNFTDLYRFSDQMGVDLIPIDRLAHEVMANHPGIEQVKFWACDLDQNVSLGHMVLELERSSPYDEEYIVASVRFDRTLPRQWVRFVCCKELMHVFDRSLEKTNDRERFLRLMSELENGPIAVDQSPMFTSERNAEWMALITLCPLTIWKKYAPEVTRGAMTDKQFAQILDIPQGYIKAIMSPTYLRSIENLTGDTSATIKLAKKGAAE